MTGPAGAGSDDAPTCSSSAPAPPAPAPPGGWRRPGSTSPSSRRPRSRARRSAATGSPRAASRPLEDMGVDTSPAAGWVRHKGLRVHGGGQVVEVDWPQLDTWPDYSLVRRRSELDALLAAHAAAAGARLHTEVTVTEPAARRRRPGRRRPRRSRAGQAPGHLARAAGRLRRGALRPAGQVAGPGPPRGPAARRRRPPVRPRRPRTDDDYLDISFDLSADGPTAASMPGYGWIFGMGDGTANVGFGLLDTRRGDGGDHRAGAARMAGHLPRRGPARRGARGHARCAGPACRWPCTASPPTRRGLLLAGDAAGTVNPFNGEGISYAMETGRMAAETAVDALARPEGPAREAVLRALPRPAARRVRPAPPARHRVPGPARAARTSSGSPPRTASSGPRWSTPRCG